MSKRKIREILVSNHTLEEHYLADERRPQYVMLRGRRAEITTSILLKYGSFIVKMKALDEYRNPVYILENDGKERTFL